MIEHKHTMNSTQLCLEHINSYQIIKEYSYTYNIQYRLKKKVSIAIHSGNNTDANLKAENLELLYNKLDNIEKKIKEIITREGLLIKKYEGHYKSIINVL